MKLKKMKMHLRIFLPILITLMTFSLSGQDMHFTQYNMSPLNLNPALTGAFYGSYRIGGIYRDQYRSIQYRDDGAKPYQTVSLSVDSPIIRGFRKQDWIGVGVNFFYDRAGSSVMTNQGQLLSIAYHLGLGKKKQTSVLTIGGQFGAVQRRLDPSQITTPVSVEFGMDPDIQNFQGLAGSNDSGKLESNFTDWNVGALLTVDASKTTSFRFGYAVAHITRPGRSFNGGNRVDRIPIRNTAFATMYVDVSDRYTLTPSILFQNMAKSTEIVAQVMNSLLINEESELAINAGLGFRIADSPDLQLIVGADIKDIRVGLAYDVNLSNLTPATNGNGGFELAVTYIGKIYKKPKVKPILICPRL